MGVKLSNNATSTLASGITDVATSLSVQSGDATLFPSLSTDEWFPITVIDSSGNMELMRVTARTGAVLTVTRAQEGTTAQAFDAGSRVDLRLTAAGALSIPEAAVTGATAKTTPADADLVGLIDSAANYVMKKLTWANIKTALQTFFDSRYLQLTDASLVGSIGYFATSTPPSGWVKANGAALSRTTYADLFAVIGTTWGSGDGSTTFNVPDLRGEFLRSWDDGRGIDTGRSFASSQDDQNASHTHTGTTNSDSHSHTGTTASSGSHSHSMSFDGGTSAGTGSAVPATSRATTSPGPNVNTAGNHNHTFTTSSDAHSHGFTTDASGESEARPRNIALLACIKY